MTRTSPSLPSLSPAQQEAVRAPLADALVTAGAGSGKTRVLTERFVHLVCEENVPLRRLAALTFTEKAAAQMRDRTAALFRRGHDEAQRADVEFAAISTIHAFCASLLRQHAIEAGIDPAFQVLDALEAGLLREEAALQAEAQLEQQRPELLELFHVFSGEAREALLRLLDQLRGAGCAIADIRWKDAQADILAATVAVEEAFRDYAGVGEFLPEERQQGHSDALVRVSDALEQLRAGENEITPFLAAQAKAAVEELKGPRQRAYAAPRKALGEALETLTGALLDKWGGTVLLPALKEVLTVYEAAYSRLKDEQSRLDFTDLELRTRDLLRRSSRAGRVLDLAPKALLVDEFQDTNPLQAEILATLRRQAPQFSVGDPKQSIYRFRGADVRVILEERERVGASGRYAMNASYRACPELVRVINALGERLFADGRAGVAYEPLVAAATYLPPSSPPAGEAGGRPMGQVELALIDAGKRTPASEARKLEAAWIARRIEELTDGRTMRLKPGPLQPGPLEPSQGEASSVGPLKRGDVAILFRAGTNLAIYEAALEARGIPFLTQKSASFFRAEEITDLMHVLRVIHNPGDLHALACMVTGPVMGAGDGELLRWFEPGPGTPWERLVAEGQAGGPHAEAVALLLRLRKEAVDGSLAEVVERVLFDLGLLETALLHAAGDRRAANLRKAVDVARRLDEGGRRGLADLLRHLATLKDRQTGEAEAPIGGEADDVVRLTTVHGAKGLEYPVVFVADIGHRGRGSTPVIQYDGASAVAVRVKDPVEGITLTPAGYTAIADVEKQQEAEEAQRLLYVAMTRAEERLILSGWCTGQKKDGLPSYLRGWGADLWQACGAPFEVGAHDVLLDEAAVRVWVLDGSEIALPEASPADVRAVDVQVGEAERAEAALLLTAAAQPVAPLGDTRYVVSVSELLTFARSPQAYYVERVINAGARGAVSASWDKPAAEDDVDLHPGGHPEAGRRSDRITDWDEEVEGEGSLDRAALGRAALGRAVHAVLERLGPESGPVAEALILKAVEEEGGGPVVCDAVREMAERFRCCSTGQALVAAQLEGADVRREVALHARIRFPGGEKVGGFDSLLVKGSIDLWLPGPEGVVIVDYKTNRAGARFRTPEDLADHYAWQLRLYALAVERVLGEDVAGARLVLLDPGWGRTALEVCVDISGEYLEDARRLCRAFALAELEGRYPADWRSLLS